MHLVCVACCIQATTSIRKGNKKLAMYDLKITMKWEAQADDDAEQVCSSQAAEETGEQQVQNTAAATAAVAGQSAGAGATALACYV
jgi:hypothetical protein